MNLRKRLLFGIGLPRLTMPSDETATAQRVQAAHQTTGELQEGVPSFQLYGFASALLRGCDLVMVYAEGDRAKGIAAASNDQRYRPKNMQPGETQIHDNAGQSVYLKRGQIVAVNATSEIDLFINGVAVARVTATGLQVMGTITATGNITAGQGGTDQVDMQGHTHHYSPGTGSPTPTTAPVAGT